MLIYSDNGATAIGGVAGYKGVKRRKKSSSRVKASKGKRRSKKRHTVRKKVKKVKKSRRRRVAKIKNLTAKNKNFLKTLGLRVKKH